MSVRTCPSSNLPANNPERDGGRFTFPVSLQVGTYTVFLTSQVPPHPQFALPQKIVMTSLPRKYMEAKTSGLSIAVKEGKNDVLLDLTD